MGFPVLKFTLLSIISCLYLLQLAHAARRCTLSPGGEKFQVIQKDGTTNNVRSTCLTNDSTGNESTSMAEGEPRMVNYTLTEMKALFPWISNYSKGETEMGKSGLTKFNNPNLLCSRLYGLTPGSCGFRPTEGVESINGGYKVKLIQEWRNMTVYGPSLVLDQDSNGNLILESAEGEVLSHIEEDILSEVPTISQEDAIQRAIKYTMDKGNIVKKPSARLVINTIGTKAVLVYLINYRVPGDSQHPEPEAHMGRRQWVVMDANSGSVYQQWNGIASAQRMSRYPLRVGYRGFTKVYNEYVLEDIGKGKCYYQRTVGNNKRLTVREYNDWNSNYRYAYKFQCEDADLNSYDVTNGAKSPRNAAYKWASEGINFLQSTSASNINFHVDVEVHSPGVTAFYDGDKVSLGDGDNGYFYPMTGPDVVVHEITHVFTAHKSGLQHFGQSGGIDEAYSDMAACAFKNDFFKDNSASVYRIGSSVTKSGAALRDMCNPRSSNLLLYNPNKPIIVHIDQWERRTPLHNASALYNKAFCNLSKKSRWNIQLAFKVFTKANVLYWSPSETFDSGVCGVRKAARDLFNTNQAVKDVEDSFDPLGIKCRTP